MTSSERLIAKSLDIRPSHRLSSLAPPARFSSRVVDDITAATMNDTTVRRLISYSKNTTPPRAARARVRVPTDARPRSIPAPRLTPSSSPRSPRLRRASPRPRPRRARDRERRDRDASTPGTPPGTASRPRARISRARSASPAPCARASASRASTTTASSSIRVFSLFAHRRECPTAAGAVRGRRLGASETRAPTADASRLARARATIVAAAATARPRAGAAARDATRRRRGFPRIQSRVGGANSWDRRGSRAIPTRARDAIATERRARA